MECEGSTTNIEGEKPCLSRRQVGVLIITFGIFWVSPDSVLIRLAEREHTGDGCIVFYKYVFKSAATWLGFLIVFGGPRGLLEHAKRGGWHFFVAALLEGCAEAMFTLGVGMTTAANNLVFLSANPLWCSIWGFLLLGERPPRRTIVTLLLGFGAIMIVFIGTKGDTPSGKESLEGDILALCTGIVLSLYLTVCRHAGKVRPNATLVPSSGLGCVISLVIGLFLTQGEVGSTCMPKSGAVGWLPIAINGAIVMPISLACFAIAPKYLPGSEVGLIMLLEVVLGPLWVWMAIGEMPSVWTLIGGGLLVICLAIHETMSMRVERIAAKAGETDQTKCSQLSEETGDDPETCIRPAADSVDVPSTCETGSSGLSNKVLVAL